MTKAARLAFWRVEFRDSLDPVQSLIIDARNEIALCLSPRPSSLSDKARGRI